MSLETMLYFCVEGIIIVMILNALSKVISHFMELSDKLSSLIEVTYQATHDPDFCCKFAKKANEEKEDVIIQ